MTIFLGDRIRSFPVAGVLPFLFVFHAKFSEAGAGDHNIIVGFQS